MSLEPLKCSSCGGSVPLLEGDSFPCPYCAQELSVPPEYSAWRLRKKENIEADQRLFHLHESLGKTPRFWERGLAKVQSFGCFGGCLVSIVVLQFGGYLLAAEFGILEWLLKDSNPNPDGISSGLATTAVLLPYFIPMVLILLWIAHSHRKVITLSSMQGKLTANPPVHPGGPSGCRSCGASLEVKSGEASSSCFYCGTLNLVALEEAWIQRLLSQTQSRNESFAEAIAAFDKATRAGRFKLLRNCVLFFLLGFVIKGSLDKSSDERWPPTGFESQVQANKILGPHPATPELRLGRPLAVRYQSLDYDLKDDFLFENALVFLVPLRTGETLEMQLLEGDPASQVRLAPITNMKHPPRNLESIQVKDRKSHFQAPQDSWYYLSLNPPEGQEEGRYKIKFRVPGREVDTSQGKPEQGADETQGPKGLKPYPLAQELVGAKILPDQALSVDGLRPGSTRKEVEALLGTPIREWQNFTHYGEVTVCYEEEKALWVRSLILSQGESRFAFTGEARDFYDVLAKHFGKSFFESNLTYSKRPAEYSSRSHYFTHLNDLVIVSEKNGQYLSVILARQDLLRPKASTPKIFGEKLVIGSYTIHKGEKALSEFLQVFGGEYASFLLARSTDEKLLPEALLQDEKFGTFQYWLSAHPRTRDNRVLFEWYKNQVHKVEYF